MLGLDWTAIGWALLGLAWCVGQLLWARRVTATLVDHSAHIAAADANALAALGRVERVERDVDALEREERQRRTTPPEPFRAPP